MDPNQFDFDADGNMVGADGHPLAPGRTPAARASPDEGDDAPAPARGGAAGAGIRDGPRSAKDAERAAVATEERSPAFGDLAACPLPERRSRRLDAT